MTAENKVPTFGFHPETGADCAIWQEGKLISYETERSRSVLEKPICDTGIWFYDPQADEPLDPQNECTMKQIGPAAFLQILCNAHNLNFSPVPTTEHETRRAARKVLRAVKEYTGEKFIQ